MQNTSYACFGVQGFGRDFATPLHGSASKALLCNVGGSAVVVTQESANAAGTLQVSTLFRRGNTALSHRPYVRRSDSLQRENNLSEDLMYCMTGSGRSYAYAFNTRVLKKRAVPHANTTKYQNTTTAKYHPFFLSTQNQPNPYHTKP